MPIPSFGERRLVNVASQLSNRSITLPIPLGSTGSGHGVNLDGLFIYSGPSVAEAHGYGLLFRDLCIEGVKQLSIRDGGPYLAGAVFEQDVFRTLRSYLRTCDELEAGYPIYAAVSICNANGLALADSSEGFLSINSVRIDRDIVTLPEFMIEEPGADLTQALKPSFDMIWNAFGYFQSQKYDTNGKWIGGT